MHTTPESTTLEAIRSGYQSVLEMTARTLEGDVSDERLQSVTAERAILLSSIEQKKNTLEQARPEWKQDSSLSGIARDIDHIIRSILDIDLRLQAVVADRLYDIKRQMGRLNTTSKAALSYASNGAYRL